MLDIIVMVNLTKYRSIMYTIKFNLQFINDANLKKCQTFDKISLKKNLAQQEVKIKYEL